MHNDFYSPMARGVAWLGSHSWGDEEGAGGMVVLVCVAMGMLWYYSGCGLWVLGGVGVMHRDFILRMEVTH